MKNIWLPFFLLGAPSAAYTQSNTITPASYQLQGKVVSVRENSYLDSWNHGDPSRKEKISDSARLSFNERGWLVERMSTRDISNLEGMAEMTTYRYDDQGRLLHKVLYEMRENNSLMKAILKTDNERSFWAVYRYDYSYDKKGRLLAEAGYDIFFIYSTEFLFYENTHRYNEQGRLAEETFRDIDPESKNVTTEKYSYSYDKEGRILSETSLNPDGSVKRVYHYSYGGKGKLSEYRETGKNGQPLKRETYRYDSSGRMTEKTLYYTGGTAEEKSVYAYDEKGNLLSFTLFKPAGKQAYAFTYRYRYDPAGNWISKEIRRDAKLVELTERIIEYAQ